MIYALPFLLHGLVLLSDEILCHYRRRLKRWERLGHGVDTISFVAVISFPLWRLPTEFNIKVYAAVAILSCLIVTKDEWHHAEVCDAFENWLHALLFMLHPTLLIGAGYLWINHFSLMPLVLATLGGSIFFIYHMLYWNWWTRDQQRDL